MAVLVAWTWKPRNVWNSWEMNTMFYTTPTSKRKQNWRESSSFLEFSWKRKRKKKRQGHVQQSWPDKDTLSHLRCVLIFSIFVFQFSKSLAKEVLHSQRRNVYISSLTGKILQVSLIGLLVWLTQKRLFCKRQ